MKHFIRAVIFNTLSLFFTTEIIPGFQINGGVKPLIMSGIILTLLNFFIKPLAKLLFFPINIATLGLFSWIINIAIIFSLTKFIFEIKINSWTFPGINASGFLIPKLEISSLATLIIVSFSVSLLTHFLNWIRK